jgi:hypothetical protein
MTLFFDIQVLEKETKLDSEYLVKALEHYYNNRTIPKNKYEKYKPLTKSLRGNSYLLNPRDFFNDLTTDIIYKAQYIRLAARRDYLLYKHYGFKYLDLSFLPEISINAIKTNPLITINKQILYFKYEEK